MVLAEEVQLLERRVARGVRQAERHRQAIIRGGGPDEQPDRSRAIREGARRIARTLWREPRVIEAPAKLHRHVRPRHLLIEEHRKPAFVDRWRQRFGTRRHKAPVEPPGPEAALHPADGAVRPHQLDIGGVVRERRADLVTLKFIVLIEPHTERGPDTVENALERLGAAPQRDGVPPRRELETALLDDRNAVLRVVVPVAAADVPARARPAQSHTPEAVTRLRVPDRAGRRMHVTRPAPAAADVQRDRPVADVQISRAGRLAGGRAEVERDIAADALLGLGGNLVGDDVDQPADRVGPIQQRGRATDDLDARDGRQIHIHAVIARLARQVAKALAVLQDEHAIAVKAAHHRPRRRRPEAPGGHPRLILQRGPERHFKRLRQLLARQHRRRLKRLELAARLRRHRYDLLEVQLRIDEQITRLTGLRFGAARREARRHHEQVIDAWGYGLKAERAVGGRRGGAAQFLDHHDDAGNRIARQRVEYPT